MRIVTAAALGFALVFGTTLAACGPTPPPAPPAPSAPQDSPAIAAVRAVFAAYQNPTPTPMGPSADWTSFRSKELAALYAALPARQMASDDPILDFDPVIGGQDWDLSGLTYAETPGTDPGRTTVTATFQNFGEPRVIALDLVQQDGAWKVDNIRSAAGDVYDVRAIFKAAGVG
jgi:hypothetical protein